ncbi:hypothetical protein QOT17_006182 [Balamuthia mandrillaris]
MDESNGAGCDLTVCPVEFSLQPESANSLNLSFVFEGVEVMATGMPELELLYYMDAICLFHMERHESENVNGTVYLPLACGMDEMELYDANLNFQQCASAFVGVCEECPENYSLVEREVYGQCVHGTSSSSLQSSASEESSEQGDGGDSSAERLAAVWL